MENEMGGLGPVLPPSCLGHCRIEWASEDMLKSVRSGKWDSGEAEVFQHRQPL